MSKNYFLLILIVLFLSCDDGIYKNGMVVSAKHEASKAGVDILKKGGNAFDAMIATDLALAVVYPNAGNLGVVALWFIDYQMVKMEALILEKKHLLILGQICTWIVIKM